MKKLTWYGLLSQRSPWTSDEQAWIYRFAYKKDVLGWIQTGGDKRIIAATSPEVRRVLRRMAADPALTFPIEID